MVQQQSYTDFEESQSDYIPVSFLQWTQSILGQNSMILVGFMWILMPYK